ncbi:helix-turn-helix transcriptional regulator [Rugosimonospora africana]|uniref:Transcriptional regulator n=1 Tax=Rugosimonospora africana TaxID=556532 RepID=A0A8J3QRC5_9ACTN|nr:LuxR family transcriptional regulator [Rugosimonospora africana]GIH16035.1 transcriptional regulator [Rugosimonospora africana]
MADATSWSPPLLGREPERQALDELAGTLREGLSGCLVLTGEAGIGKTRLLDYLAAATPDLQTATVVGLEVETQLGFAALHRLLLPFLDGLPRLPGPQRDALGAAFGLVAGPPPDRFLIGLAVLTLLADVAGQQPLLCLVDDAHWLDRESLEVLAFVGHRLHADGIGLVLAVRGGPGDLPPLQGLRALQLDGLPEDEARQLLAVASAGRLDGRVATRLVAETRGNPLALVELSRELSSEHLAGGRVLPEPLPMGPRMEAHFLRQIRTLPAPTQSFLLIASVAPADDSVVLWRAADRLGLPATAADPALAEGVLSAQGDLAFRHPLIRSAVYASAPPAQRRAAHDALAAVIDRDVDPDRRAWHLAEAATGLDEGVAQELEQASERARGRGGYTAQALFLSRAAGLTPDPHERSRRLFASAQARLASGDPVAAQTLLEQAAAGLATPTLRAQAQLLRGTIEIFFARLVAVAPIMLNAIATIDGLERPMVRRMLFEGLQAAVLAYPDAASDAGPADVARAVLRTPAVPGGSPTLTDLLLDAFATRIVSGHAAAEPLMRATLPALLHDQDLAEFGMPLAVYAAFASDDLWEERGGRAALERLITFDRQHGASQALRVTLQTLAGREVWAGRFSEAEALYIESSEITRAIGLPDDTSHRIGLVVWQGHEQLARASAEDILTLWVGQLGIGSLSTQAYLHLALLENSLGRYPEAVGWAVRVFDTDPLGSGNHILPELIEAAARTEDLDLTERALARLRERAEVAATPWAAGLLARCEALLAGESAEALFVTAVEEFGRTEIVTELARTHLLYGEWLRRQKRRTDARSQLRIAHDMFTDMGAGLFAARARRELLATGERARKRTVSDSHRLTPQETQVASLASTGATNAEIATRLFITNSTVEYHMNKVFRKLGITSRRQLTQVLRDQDGAPGPSIR